MRKRKLLIILIFCFAISGSFVFFGKIHSRPTDNKDEQMQSPVSTGSTYFLSETDIHLLEKKAEKGDKDSAFKLYQYYSLVALDEKIGYQWLVKAAENGHPIAQYNLSVSLLTNGKISDAAFWARKASDNGVELSDELNKLINEKN